MACRVAPALVSRTFCGAFHSAAPAAGLQLLHACAGARAPGCGTASCRRRLTTVLPTGNIAIPDPLKQNAVPSLTAEESLQNAESRVRADLDELASLRRHAVEATSAGVSEDLQKMRRALQSAQPEERLLAARQCRGLLASAESEGAPVEVIQDIISAGIVPILVRALGDASSAELQFEAAWSLTNIASGNTSQTQAVVKSGALPEFIRLLRDSDSRELRDQAIWALGNVAGDSALFRDQVLAHGGLQPVLDAALPDFAEGAWGGGVFDEYRRNAAWALANLCRGKPAPHFSFAAQALPALSRLILVEDVGIATDACWAVAYLSDGPEAYVSAVVEAGLCRSLVELAMHPQQDNTARRMLQAPALRALGNIVAGSDEQADAALHSGLLRVLAKVLDPAELCDTSMVRDACWTLSNLTAGTQEQIHEVVIHHDFVPRVLALLSGEAGGGGSGETAVAVCPSIRKEAAWVLSNAAAGGTAEHVAHLIECGCIEPLLNMLGDPTSDSEVPAIALRAIEHMISSGERARRERGLAANPHAARVERAAGGPQALRALLWRQQQSAAADTSEEARRWATEILRYFPEA